MKMAETLQEKSTNGPLWILGLHWVHSFLNQMEKKMSKARMVIKCELLLGYPCHGGSHKSNGIDSYKEYYIIIKEVSPSTIWPLIKTSCSTDNGLRPVTLGLEPFPTQQNLSRLPMFKPDPSNFLMWSKNLESQND